MRNKLPKKLPIKKGPLSTLDMKMIEELSTTELDNIAIAQKLNRSPKQIEKYRKEWLAKAPRVTVARNEAAEFKRELIASAPWASIKDQFTDKELIFYENAYIEYRRTLKDISSTEKTQLHQLISIDIMMNRSQIDRKLGLEEIDRLEAFLKKQHEKDFASLTRDEKEYMTHCETNLSALKSASLQRTREYNDLLSKHNDLLKSLKTTRDQRIKQLDDRGKFMSLLYELEMEDHRKPISEMTALSEMAMQRERERLAKPYTYADGTIDQPLLSAATNLEEIE